MTADRGLFAALSRVCPDVREATEDDAITGVIPSWTAAPATAAEAAALMRLAAHHDLAVTARGAGTKLDWGNPPRRADLLVDLGNLDGILEHQAGDLVVRVQPGVRLDPLARILAEQGQQLALDDPVGGATVGGTISTAVCGPRRLRYGAPRDLLIGVTTVLADGTITRSGGKVIKNVAGYDLGKLFTGAFGTLGLVVEAVFRLHPLPAACAWLILNPADRATAVSAMRTLLHSQAAPSAIEWDSAQGPPEVAALFEGGAAESRAAALRRSLGDGRTSDRPPPWWGTHPDGTLIEVRFPVGRFSEVLGEIDEAARDHAVAARTRGGFGLLHVGVSEDPADAPDTAAFIMRIRGNLAALGGVVIVRRAAGAVRDRVDVWGPGGAVRLMRRVKERFDPQGLLSPGRLVGGV
ncbi:FAD-binding oxidoreductase [Rhizohabitans arisaemae]|uniref:FAD-binding oxidoreductase n=1 Tax=Rhizohabitans arisaemae TaxID=2720610 RepID=UPI0024B078AB|nr:FAD-binding oxidoreductase [Rhizohabitans arisaemae]